MYISNPHGWGELASHLSSATLGRGDTIETMGAQQCWDRFITGKLRSLHQLVCIYGGTPFQNIMHLQNSSKVDGRTSLGLTTYITGITNSCSPAN